MHLRVAKGETLDPAEQAEYAAGLEKLDQEEKTQFEQSDLARLRRLRTQVEEMRTTHSQLLKKSTRLDGRIMTLEQAYQALTGYELANEPHASAQV